LIRNIYAKGFNNLDVTESIPFYVEADTEVCPYNIIVNAMQ